MESGASSMDMDCRNTHIYMDKNHIKNLGFYLFYLNNLCF